MTTPGPTTTSPGPLGDAAPTSARPVPGRAAVVRSLAALEVRRLLRHPAPPIGLVLSAVMAWDSYTHRGWTGSAYMALQVCLAPLLLGISLAAASATARDHALLAEEAPVTRATRALARLLAGLVPVAFVALLTTAGAIWLRAQGGLDMGDPPGFTLHAHYTLPELVQPVLLAGFAVAVGSAAGHLLRARFSAPLVLLVGWFAVSGTYWVFNSPTLMAASVIQVQPLTVRIAGPAADPSTFPADWWLRAPNQYENYWGHLVVSPELAAWHGVYLVALTALAAAVVLPRPWRRSVAGLALVVAIAAVVVQKMVQP